MRGRLKDAIFQSLLTSSADSGLEEAQVQLTKSCRDALRQSKRASLADFALPEIEAELREPGRYVLCHSVSALIGVLRARQAEIQAELLQPSWDTRR